MSQNQEDTSSTRDGTLTDFGGGTDTSVEPPTIKKQGRVLTPVEGTTRVVGHHGYVPERDAKGFIKEVQRSEHYLRAVGKHGGWAISDHPLELLKRFKVEVVLIADTESENVWEYRLRDFTDYGSAVPEDWLQDPADTQTWVDASKFHHFWECHQRDVVLPMDEDVDDDDTGFTPASNL